MVRDHEERGVSTFNHDRYQMDHVFEMMILRHITDRSTRVYMVLLSRRSSLELSLSPSYRSLAGTRYSIGVWLNYRAIA